MTARAGSHRAPGPRTGTVAVVATGVVTLAVWAAARAFGVPFADLSREPVTTLHGPRYTGWYAHLVIFVWMLPAGGALVGALVLHRVGRLPGARFLLLGGVLTAAMVADDLFLLHEAVYPKLGLPAEVVYLGYATATALYAWRFRDRMGRDVLLLGAAYAMWAVSIGFDVVLDEAAPLVLEDSAKASGTVLWALFLVRRTAGELVGALRPGAAASPHPLPAQRTARRPEGLHAE